MSQSAFWFKEGLSCLGRRVWHGTYTYCGDVDVRQNVEDRTVSLLEEPWLSMCLNYGREGCWLGSTESGCVHEQIM